MDFNAFATIGDRVEPDTRVWSLTLPRPSPCSGIADRGYDSRQIFAHAQNMGAIVVIPSKINRRQQRQHDQNLYKLRNRIERCFNQSTADSLRCSRNDDGFGHDNLSNNYFREPSASFWPKLLSAPFWQRCALMTPTKAAVLNLRFRRQAKPWPASI
ncbi:transposase [Edaphobacter bradus]|uniref:transposase n=1 Tax=Edaphobacter bradus TaxID=2259016 RepID=UPI0037BFF350